MNTNLKRFLLCPIPEDQKPIQLYQKAKENDLMNWVTWSQKKYEKSLFSVFLCSFSIGCVIRFGELLSFSYLLEWILANILFSLIVLIFFLGIIFFRWKQVEQAFMLVKVFYEEGSWSDGQIWEKPNTIQKMDELIHKQKIVPILQRITRSLYDCTSLILLIIILFEIL